MSQRFTTRPEILGTFGMVATTHWIGTAVGMGILERGGNAFDAAVATAFALQIAEPHLNGPAGDTPVILHDARRGKSEVICGQGPAPAAATIAHYRSVGIDLIPGNGLLAACVPGSFDTWMLMLRDYGTMSLPEVLGPAIGYARHGVPLVARVVATIGEVEALFREHWHTSAQVYLPGGAIPKAGELFANPDLAETYERLLREAEAGGGGRERVIERARHVWSQGFIAEAVDRFCRSEAVFDSTGRRNRGVLTGADMAAWQATVEEPIGYRYRDRYEVLKPGPWAQGLVALQQLALLSGFDLDGMDPTDPDFIHLQVECAKLAFDDREAFYGDPKFVDVPVGTLLSEPYNAARRALVGAQAHLDPRPGVIEGYASGLSSPAAGAPAVSAFAGTGEPTVGRSSSSPMRGDTVHFDIIDRAGNMVSATPSGGWLQSSPVIPGLGFPLGTRAQMFWLEEGLPASLAPGKRPRTTLTPTLALRDGEPWLAWGSPGGDQQDQWIPQMFVRHVHCGLNLQEAIDAPAWHIEHFRSSFWPRRARPGVMVVEGRMPAAIVAELRRRGHEVEIGGDWSEGRLTAASREGGMLKAAANPRGMQGYAAGR